MGDDEDSENDDWVESVPIRHTRALYEVLDARECLALARAEVSQVCELLCCEADVAASLLRQFHWNREKLTAVYLEDPEKTLTRAGFQLGQNVEMIHLSAEQVIVGGVTQPSIHLPEIKCPICFEPKKRYSSLGCGHRFCNDCYSLFLSHKIKDEGRDC